MSPLDWRAFLSALDPTLRLAEGATSAALMDAERSLGHPLPPELRSLLAAADGIADEPQWSNFLWSLDQLVQQNLWLRSADCPFSNDAVWTERVCFASNQADATFFIPSSNGELVWAWHPIGNELQVIAEDLPDYLRGWISGTIST